MPFLGIDLGTSAVKTVLVGDRQEVLAEAAAPLAVHRPRPRWSEQNPEDWWSAVETTVAHIRATQASALAAVRGIGLSGQMHGATLLDQSDRVLRPAILWNDGRSAAQCAELERREPRAREITGNLVMAGFTAPKLLWVAEHEPEVAARVAHVLLPKDYLRLRMTGEYASDLSDASGTSWLDVGRRAWSPEMLAATGVEPKVMPRLFEGSVATARIRSEVGTRWGISSAAVVAGGGGDNAAGAVGVGVIDPGQAFLSLGTSGVYFVAGARFAPDPDRAIHAFCHCLPGRWHQMSVILSAASCVAWLAAVTGAGTVEALLAEAEAADRDPHVLFLPYLSGERTPHNDPFARGVFFGLTHDTTRADLARAVLEGVALAFADGQEALLAAGTGIDDVTVIGGGAPSRLWGRILASALGRPLRYGATAEIGPAFGAARLARLAATGEDPSDVCSAVELHHVVEPDSELVGRYAERRVRFDALYVRLAEAFHARESICKDEGA